MTITKLTENYEEQLKKGIQVEKEHKNTYDFIKSYIKKYKKMPSKRDVYLNIAKDHLKEHDNYYDRLLKAGL